MFQWTQEMSVNVKEIDVQHQVFVGIINELLGIYDQVARRAVLDAVLAKLRSYAEFHFKTEEKYFILFDYEEKIEHTLEHRAMLAKIETYLQRFETGEDVTDDAFRFVVDWLSVHLMEHDKKYVACFNAHGLY
ncbi:MAG: bacteriohemerythrin [Patescibacteria group bacterium]|nr:bacteriohemerythrin [Patescibacteria group bacterium]